MYNSSAVSHAKVLSHDLSLRLVQDARGILEDALSFFRPFGF